MLETIITKIDQELQKKGRLIVAIDGRCASGKTTLADKLQDHYGCNLVHMDEFFLRPEQRTPQRFQTPGENVDHERFLEEVLLPLSRGEDVSYRPFRCSTQTLAEPIQVGKHPLTIVEGSYSFHKNLRGFYDLKIFLTVDPATQMERIIRRNGEGMAEIFCTRWIPMEETYFGALEIAQYADLSFSTEAKETL